MNNQTYKTFNLSYALLERIRQEALRRSPEKRCSDAELIRQILDANLPPLEGDASEGK